MNEKLYDKVLGCLTGAAIGDAMGAPTEGLSKEEVEAIYGGRITYYEHEKDNKYCYGNTLGEITDDASQMYEMAKAVADCGGNLTVEATAEALVRWSESYPKYYPRNAGATTSRVIADLKDGKDPVALGKIGGYVGRGTTNGAAMRIAAAGLTAPGDLEKAVRNAVVMCTPSHGTQHAFSGACAIACGISEALTEDATTVSIVKACVYGARRGEEIGNQKGRRAEGIRVLNNIGTALREAMLAENMEDAEDRLDAWVGADGSIQASIGLCLGLFLASDGGVEDTILSCANVGGDSDTNACIAGSLVGAFRGYKAFPESWVSQMRSANPALDLESVAKRLTEICENAGK